jgi:hypothetical protein
VTLYFELLRWFKQQHELPAGILAPAKCDEEVQPKQQHKELVWIKGEK